MAAKKDPTVSSSSQSAEGVSSAPAVSDADDSADSLKYEDMPAEDKPDPTTVAQVQVLPDEES